MWRLYDRLEITLALLLLTATVLSVLVAAVGRSIGMPVTSAPQFAQLFLLWTCMFGADLCMRHGEHIRVTALPDLVSERARRGFRYFLRFSFSYSSSGSPGTVSIWQSAIGLENWAAPD